MITYKGLPGPQVSEFLSREDSGSHYTEGTVFHIGQIVMVANTGTYVDAPFHRYTESKDLSELSPEAITDLEDVVFRADTAQWFKSAALP